VAGPPPPSDPVDALPDTRARPCWPGSLCLPSPTSAVDVTKPKHEILALAACDWLAAVAFRERCANKIELQKIAYYEARATFGLASQLTIRAIGKTVDAYKRDKTTQPRFKPHGAIPYDQRILAWRGIEAVSLLTLSGRVVIPIRFGGYQRERLDRARGQADLVYRDGTFFLYATIDAPEPTPIEAEDYLGVDMGIVGEA
jgi:putative transposase